MYIANSPLKYSSRGVVGQFVEIDSELYYKIDNFDEMPPFFMSIVSSSDHWLFISSNGALSAGRKNPEMALFPYYTDDKIQDSPEITGSKTILRVEKAGRVLLWEPFSDRYGGLYSISRNLYKNAYGNKVLFEEINHDLGLSFRYGWYNSDAFGLVRTSWLSNLSEEPVALSVLDGVQNLMPYGVLQATQNRVSTLVDAYKKNELDAATGLGMYMLSAIIVDRAEPSEALKCNTVWATGLPKAKRLISSKQLPVFRRTGEVTQEVDVRAERGAYFLNEELQLGPGGEKSWSLVLEVNQGPAAVANLVDFLSQSDGLAAKLAEDIEQGTQKLVSLVGSSDGLQLTAGRLMTTRHFANVLFNIMRGGVLANNYEVQLPDFLAYVSHCNKKVWTKYAEPLQKLPAHITYADLLQKTQQMGLDLLRLTYEYLPLTFSRRHGDPSRPWNKFSIEVKNEQGEERLYYAGNWRDIFQNWEALAYSFPGFTESMIAKFVNASTVDGYNPYRITRDGIDWETIEPDDPWSYIGYWGDHQIIYLQKLLEVSYRHHPGGLQQLLSAPLFSYANVPYRIKPYTELLKDPYDTVLFDDDLELKIEERVEQMGTDGKMVLDQEESVYRVNLTEKLLVTLLAKLSNFIPEAGIWLNTQRPEWNDANNALVGNGISMVTLYYLRRFLTFCKDLFPVSSSSSFEISSEVASLLYEINKVFSDHLSLLESRISDQDRKRIQDGLGRAGSTYRETIYANGFAKGKASISQTEIRLLIDCALEYVDHTIQVNKRDDGLYHAYNLLAIGEKEFGVSHLYEMLEGQVAVLSSGYLSAAESLSVLKALRSSAMYRADQHSYLLYPDRDLARFLNKNTIPSAQAGQSKIINTLLERNDESLVERDGQGRYHFNGDIRNADDIRAILDQYGQEDKDWTDKDEAYLLELFEELFDHKSFTGRSGTFFGYEGLGSIYWHMVSKLLLATQECYFAAIETGADQTIVDQLAAAYYDIREGIGFNKSPDNYGAFPTDPYSHTPAHAGAQQPGMTGQVKEDVLARFGELGVLVEQGTITFQPSLLRTTEFLSEAEVFRYYNLQGEQQSIKIPAGSLAFTYCQVPVVYYQSAETRLEVQFSDGKTLDLPTTELPAEFCQDLFNRRGNVRQINVWVNVS